MEKHIKHNYRTEKIKNKYIMTRGKLNKLLSAYSYEAYWYGEKTGFYGRQEPQLHKATEKELWEQLDNYRIITDSHKSQIRLRLDQFKKVKELIEGWKITKDSKVVKRNDGPDYAEGYMDALETCLKLLQSGKYLETD